MIELFCWFVLFEVLCLIFCRWIACCFAWYLGGCLLFVFVFSVNLVGLFASLLGVLCCLDCWCLLLRWFAGLIVLIILFVVLFMLFGIKGCLLCLSLCLTCLPVHCGVCYLYFRLLVFDEFICFFLIVWLWLIYVCVCVFGVVFAWIWFDFSCLVVIVWFVGCFYLLRFGLLWLLMVGLLVSCIWFCLLIDFACCLCVHDLCSFVLRGWVGGNSVAMVWFVWFSLIDEMVDCCLIIVFCCMFVFCCLFIVVVLQCWLGLVSCV